MDDVINSADQSNPADQAPLKSLQHETVIPISDEFAAHLATTAAPTQPAPQPVQSPTVEPVMSQTQPTLMPSAPLLDTTADPTSLQHSAITSTNPELTTFQPSAVSMSIENQSPVMPTNTPPSSPNSFDPLQLTPEQQQFINGAAWGPILSWIYYLGNRAWLYACIFLFGPIVISYGVSFFVSAWLNRAIAQGPVTVGAGFISAFIGVAAIVILSFIINFGSLFFNIFRGRRIAWKSRRWPTFESFQKSQKIWSLWAKILFGLLVAIPLLGIISAIALVAINPAARIQQANKAALSSNPDPTTELLTVSTAMESCYVKNSGSYLHCLGVTDLVSGGFILSKDLPNALEVTISTSTDASQAIASVTLPEDTHPCEVGTGTTHFDVYYSTTAQTKIVCSDTQPTATELLATPTN